MMQHAYCTDITWDDAQIGNIAFYPDDEHVGIVTGWDVDGNILIVHCASGYNNVVITGKEGFISVVQPGGCKWSRRSNINPERHIQTGCNV